jgi:hypothetical protein
MANMLRRLLRFSRACTGTFHAVDQRSASRLSAALVIALITCFAVTMPLTLPAVALAETVQDPVRLNQAHSDRLSVPEVQGLGCITAGAAGAIGAYVYSDMMVMAVAASAGAGPAIGLPLIVSGFVTGCGVGTTIMPILLHFAFGYSM